MNASNQSAARHALRGSRDFAPVLLVGVVVALCAPPDARSQSLGYSSSAAVVRTNPGYRVGAQQLNRFSPVRLVQPGPATAFAVPRTNPVSTAPVRMTASQAVRNGFEVLPHGISNTTQLGPSLAGKALTQPQGLPAAFAPTGASGPSGAAPNPGSASYTSPAAYPGSASYAGSGGYSGSSGYPGAGGYGYGGASGYSGSSYAGPMSYPGYGAPGGYLPASTYANAARYVAQPAYAGQFTCRTASFTCIVPQRGYCGCRDSNDAVENGTTD